MKKCKYCKGKMAYCFFEKERPKPLALPRVEYEVKLVIKYVTIVEEVQ